ncbi:MAG TPA: polysaccharide biosynthesis/export family protein [Terriglobales bacterium]|nr:polysaccharide biosynthesis/export family protein [Terriglobales bacterium]
MTARWGSAAALAAALLLPVRPAAAQQAVAPLPLAVANAVPASYLVGPNDVLAMAVFGAPELNDPAMRVDANGTIHTPYGSTPVKVAGLTLAGIRLAIAAELVKDHLAVNPRVEVNVVDAESHPITISGMGVRKPGTIQAVQPIRLLDALNQAGGLSASDGAEIAIVRHGPHGAEIEQRFAADKVLSAARGQYNPWLRGGEEISVMPGGNAYLSGAVMLPGAFPLSDTDPLTVRKLLAKGHGFAPAANTGHAQLIHHVGEPDQTVATINLGRILSGSSPDIPLAANDMVYVPVSGFKKAGLSALDHTISAITFAAGYLLVQ